MGADAQPPGSKGIGDRVFGQYGVATVVMQILLMVGGFDVDGGVELTFVDVMRESGPCGESRHMLSINLSQRLGL